MSHLGKKRLEAIFTLTSYAVSGGTASAIPTPCVEVPKQLVLTASDVFMYATIWKIYFEEDLSNKDLLAVLAELGLITVAAAGTAYVVTRGSTAILKEITEWLGPVSWGVLAAIAGSLTGLVGAAWIVYCDRLYLQKEPKTVRALRS